MVPHNIRRFAAVVVLAAALPLIGADDKKKEKKEWDVSNFTDQTYEIEINTDEGTWISLDVSPDGKHIVFDMLGDIFIMPISGGEAKAIASGLPWEMQPRFSPDGKRIAFTSDRGGGDNIWTMATDGSDAKQVTKESFRLLNSPAWSPDGRYIVARKHFTSARSLGAGEIWMYHVSGGGGIQLNVKPNDQKDLGEPAFSHDGRYVYFSQDTTPGNVFEYSKDPSPGIYSIKRIDQQKGGIETVLSGTGGAIRPTPSPDGKHLAFIRRHNYDTKLWVHDMETGKNTIVYDKLDRDMQETWAVHGVYAGIAWTPDSKNLVFWADGKIHSLDVASKKATEIPFRVKQKHTMVNVLRYPVEVAPETYRTHMLRWVSVSPKGDKVVYQALGKLYIRDLPEGEPRRLTDDQDNFEFYPSWSRDGERIVYVTYHDENLGSVRVVSASGGESKELTHKKGHYIAPVFSPDGQTVIYTKSSGGYLRSPLYGKKTGLYKYNMSEAEHKRIVDYGVRPHFGKQNDRVFYTTYGAKGKQVLNSIGLNGKDHRTHVETSMGHELCVSPDGQWLSFVENWKVYVSPFTMTSKSYSISPNSSNVPVKQVSGETGEGLHWSGDSKRLYWSLGSKLYHRELKDAFAFVEGAPDELPKPVKEGTDIGFDFKSDVPTGTVALVGARIITMKGDQVIENGTIVVEGNRIEAVGRKGRVKVPNGAHKIDVSGKTIIPGILDVHAHGAQAAQEITPQQNWMSYGTLAFGVTTIHDPSNDTSSIFAASELQRAGMIVSPRIYSTGTIVYGATAPAYTVKINTQEDAALALRRLSAAGAFSIKSYNQPRRNQRQMVIKAARKEKIMVVPEGGSLYQHNMSMIADGHTGIEHNIPPARVYKDVSQFWGQSRTYYTPTLGVSYGGISGEHYWYDVTDVWEHPLLTKFVPPFILEGRARRRTKAPEEEYNHIRSAEVCKQLTDAGVKVTVGAHGQREGLASHWEMWMLAQGGMTPMEVLRSATMNGAEYLGLDKDLGSLEKGKLADLVVLNENPLENIRNSDKVSHVMLNGRVYEAATMNQVGNHKQERKPFFWERDGARSPSTDSWTRYQVNCGACTRH
ncbi:MAG: amidohydrolase family protein [Acidobacteriota bacterium]|nr:amidohydrolase family protein [Acidobacteriota bacterium]